MNQSKKQILTITESEYQEHCNNHDGFCFNCGEITFGGHEPDAEHYTCENCGENQSFGIEQTLIYGKIEITE